MGPHPLTVDPSGPAAGPALAGVSHFFVRAPSSPASPSALAAVAVSTLARVPFCQAALFAGSRESAAALAGAVRAAGHAVALLSGGLSQPARMDALASLRSFSSRVAVATDVGARGVDLERVTLVVCVEPAPTAATLAHRAGRAGRFGGVGVCVSVVDGGTGAAGLGALQAALAAIGAPPATELLAEGLSPDAAHGGYEPPSAAEAGAWAAHEEGVRAEEAAAGAAPLPSSPPSPPPPPPPPGRAYGVEELLSLRPAAGPRPAGLPPAVARKEEKEEEEEAAAPPPPSASLLPPTPAQAHASRPAASTGASTTPAYDGSVYDDDAALAAAIIAAHWAADDGEEEGEEEEAWCPPPPPLSSCSPSAAPWALPDAALVPVPAWLLRRYYELEWDAWSRRVEAWRAVQGGGGY